MAVTAQGLQAERALDLAKRVAVQERSFVVAQTATGVPASTPAEGTFYGDEATNALWLYIGGAWRCVSGVSGTVTIHWPGGSFWSDEMTITHGLGYSPRTIQLTPRLATGQSGLFADISDSAMNTSIFKAYVGDLGSTAPAAGNRGTLFWWAQ